MICLQVPQFWSQVSLPLVCYLLYICLALSCSAAALTDTFVGTPVPESSYSALGMLPIVRLLGVEEFRSSVSVKLARVSQYVKVLALKFAELNTLD